MPQLRDKQQKRLRRTRATGNASRCRGSRRRGHARMDRAQRNEHPASVHESQRDSQPWRRAHNHNLLGQGYTANRCVAPDNGQAGFALLVMVVDITTSSSGERGTNNGRSTIYGGYWRPTLSCILHLTLHNDHSKKDGHGALSSVYRHSAFPASTPWTASLKGTGRGLTERGSRRTTAHSQDYWFFIPASASSSALHLE